MKKIIVLGASGSIGIQTLDVIKNHPEEFELSGISVGHNITKLRDILTAFSIYDVCVADADDAEALKHEYPHIHFYYGEPGMCELIERVACDVVVNAVVGFRGLLPSLTAIRCHRVLALANKESLVAGGDLVKAELKKYQGNLYPIDSEHSAIFQCLQGNEAKTVEHLMITASGGSFRDKTREELNKVTVAQALHHPNWSMGGRITIDSATMMNKGFEVIEAHYLFDIPYDRIKVLLHPQSIVHSMVQYTDQAVIAQLGTADMKLPIQYALSWPSRLKLYNSEPLDLVKVGHLDFKAVDDERYPLLKLAFTAGRRGGNSGAILNGADEAAVDLFLHDKISFLEIEEAIFAAYKHIPYIADPSLDDLIETDRKAREYVYREWKGVLS